MTNRVQEAIDVLLDAFNNDELEALNCKACAVGNLVAAGYRKKGVEDFDNSLWRFLFCTEGNSQYFSINNLTSPSVISNIEATEFTWEELAKIEHAFETTYRSAFEETILNARNIDEVDFIKIAKLKALEEVVKVMMSFDEIKEDVQEVFTSKAEVAL